MEQQIGGPPSKKTSIIKFSIFAIVIISVSVVIIFLGVGNPFKPSTSSNIKDRPSEGGVVIKSIAKSKAQINNYSIIDEWNGFRFRYPSDWNIEKIFKEEVFIGIRVNPSDKKNENDNIMIGGSQSDCSDAKMTKCVMVGYGEMLPIYTYSKEDFVFLSYAVVVDSVLKDFQGYSSYDVNKMKDTIGIFIEAEKVKNFNEARKVMTPDLLNGYNSNFFGATREGGIGRYEFVENIKKINNSIYLIKTRVFIYIDDAKNEIGFLDYSFEIKEVNGKYLLDKIIKGSFQSSNKNK